MISLLNNKNNGIILYGAGFLAPDFIWFCRKNNVKIKYILDKKFKERDKFLGIDGIFPENFYPSEEERKQIPVVITVIREALQKEIKEYLSKKGFEKIYTFNEVREYQEYFKKFLNLDISFRKFPDNQCLKGSNTSSTAVILHLFYPDLIHEINFFLANINDFFDLYVSVPLNLDINMVKDELKKGLKNIAKIKIYRFENRGRDIAPFLKFLKEVVNKNYKQVLKIHTKKSLHVNFGTIWRRQLYSRLIGSSRIYKIVKELFQSDKELGMIAPLGYLVPIKHYVKESEKHLRKLLNLFNITGDYNDFSFVAGTMFWFRPEVFKKLIEVNPDNLEFEPEEGQLDGTLAHGFERFFGVLPAVQGYKVLQIDEEGEIK